MKRLIGFLLFLVVAVVGLSFAVLNAETVLVNYYFGTVQIPLALGIVFAIVIGAILGLLANLGMVLSLKGEVRRLRKRVNLGEREIKNLRELPIRELPIKE